MFEWKPEFSLDVPVVDQQHEALFKLAEDLFAAMSSGMAKPMVARTLEKLVRYTQEHFTAEEKIMRVNGYPQLAAHKAQHEALTRQVLEYQKGFEADKLIITVQVLRFIRNWLETHIKQEDRKYAEFLKAKKAA
jgi:hemerythrin